MNLTIKPIDINIHKKISKKDKMSLVNINFEGK